MNITSYKMPMIWGTLVLVIGLLYACPEADSGDSTPTLKAGDITYDSIAQGTAGTATPISSTIRDFSTLAFALESISEHLGEQVPPTIDEEDGSITTTATTSAGSYRVTITPDGITILGNPITVDFYVSKNPANITELDTVLQEAITDYGLTGDFNYIDTSEVTTMSYLFAHGYTPGKDEVVRISTRTYIKDFNGDIGNWDVSAVTNFKFMFYNAEAFNQDIGKWNVAKGINFSSMFSGAIKFNQNIGNWDVSAGKNFNTMFYRAAMFNQDIGRWTVSAVENFGDMFHGATMFNQNIGGWVVSAGTNFSSMFKLAANFNQDISRWNVKKGTTFKGMFAGATKFNQNISKWIVTAGKDFSNMFEMATNFNQDVSSWNLDPSNVNITDMFKDSGVTALPPWYQ